MYFYKQQALTFQGIATLLTITLVLWVVGFHMFTNKALAENLTFVSNTLSNSAPSETGFHTIEFQSPSGIDGGETITITFPAGFDISSIEDSDVTLSEGGVPETVVDGAPGAGEWGFGISGQVLTLTAEAGASIAADTDVVIVVGNPAGNLVTNPAGIGSYEFAIAGTQTDNGYARVAIVDDVLVTAQINTTFTFTVSGLPDGVTVNGSPTTTSTTTTSSTLPFELLNAGVSKTLGQRLNVSTNARNGYVVTVEQDNQLESSTGADIDGFVDGNWTEVPTAWVSPSNTVTDEDTWGHWGLTSTDDDTVHRTTAGLNEFGSDEWVAASSSPVIIMGHDGPADGVTSGIGSSTIGYQVEITALQEAGDDYNTTLTYIATPTF